MPRRRLVRRCLGLIAAYAIALQALLVAGAVLPAWWAAGAATLCVTSDAGAPAPGHHESLPCCTANACHGGAALMPASAPAAPVRHVLPATRVVLALAAASAGSGRQPNWPRAPPV